jgi:hypothetical protein
MRRLRRGFAGWGGGLFEFVDLVEQGEHQLQVLGGQAAGFQGEDLHGGVVEGVVQRAGVAQLLELGDDLVGVAVAEQEARGTPKNRARAVICLVPGLSRTPVYRWWM